MREKNKIRANWKKVAEKMGKMRKRIALKIKGIEAKMERKMKTKQINNIDFLNRLMLLMGKITKIWSDIIYTKLIKQYNKWNRSSTIESEKVNGMKSRFN